MNVLNLGIKFVNGGLNATAKTGDYLLPIIGICIAILAFVTLLLLAKKGVSQFNNRFNSYFNPNSHSIKAISSKITSKTFVLISFLIVSLMIALSIFFVSTSKVFADGVNVIGTDKPEINASCTDNGNTCEPCNLINLSSSAICVKSVKVTVNQELAQYPQLANAKLVIKSFDGVLFDGCANGDEFIPSNLHDLAGHDQFPANFEINNIDQNTIRQIIGKNIFSIAITPKEGTPHTIQYDKNSTLYNGEISGQPPVDDKTYLKGDEILLSNQGSLDVHGFVFNGWSTIKDAQEPQYVAGQSVKMGDDNLVMYAVWKPKYNGHRGCQTFGPENSMASLQAAADHKIWAIETDFRMTKDRQVVCIHDATLDRTTSGTGPVNEYTLAEIEDMEVQAVNVGPVVPQYNWDNLTHEQKRIPTMEDYFRICSEAGCDAFIELKEDDGAADSIIHQMMTLIDKYNMRGKCVVSSAFMDLLQKYRDQGGTDLVHKISGTLNQVEEVKALGNAAIALNYTKYGEPIDVTYKGEKITSLKRLAEVIHNEGLQICYRAVDDQDGLKYCVDYQIDYYPTNCLY